MSFNSLPNTDAGDDLSGVYFIGKVTVNDDPHKMRRIKVSIPGLFEGDPENLPWVAPARVGMIVNTATTGSFHLVPALGTEVKILFQQGKPLYPLYVAFPHQKDEIPAEFQTNYTKRYGFKDPEGNVLYFDTTNGADPKFSFHHVAGVTITIANNGDLSVSTTGKMLLNSGGNTEITAGGQIIMTGTQIHMNEG